MTVLDGVSVLIMIVIMFTSLILPVLVLIWIYKIKKNGDRQVEQNQDIIYLLRDIINKE